MTSLQLFLALVASPLIVILVRDFVAGLAEERLWADPARSETL